MFLGHGVDAADAGAEINADARRINGADDTAFFHSLSGSSDSELGETVAAQDFLLRHIIARLKIFDFAGDFCFVVCCIKKRDRRNTAHAVHEIVPGFFEGIADRGDNADPCHNHSV